MGNIVPFIYYAIRLTMDYGTQTDTVMEGRGGEMDERSRKEKFEAFLYSLFVNDVLCLSIDCICLAVSSLRFWKLAVFQNHLI